MQENLLEVYHSTEQLSKIDENNTYYQEVKRALVQRLKYQGKYFLQNYQNYNASTSVSIMSNALVNPMYNNIDEELYCKEILFENAQYIRRSFELCGYKDYDEQFENTLYYSDMHWMYIDYIMRKAALIDGALQDAIEEYSELQTLEEEEDE